jgi:hypothetical protein
MRRWDFVAAYLQGSLEPGEVVYCSPPPGYTTSASGGVVRIVPLGEGDGVDRICQVVKPVYSMAQAGRRWQRTLFLWLLAWRGVGGAKGPKLAQCEMDTCIFYCSHDVVTPTGTRREHLYHRVLRRRPLRAVVPQR